MTTILSRFVSRPSLLCAALAGAVTLPTLGRQPLSWNEAVTLSAAQRGPTQLWSLLHQTDAPLGLYYFVIHFWLAALGWFGVAADAYRLRLPSALADIGTVAAVVLLITRCFSSRVALVAGVILAVHPMMTFYAQDARPYALVVLAFVASTASLIACLEKPTAVRLIAYGSLATLTLYLHLFAAFGFIGHAFLVYRFARPGERSRWAVLGSLVCAAAVPLVLISSSEHGEVGWIPHPTVRIVASVVVNIFGGVALVVAMLALTAAALRGRGTRRRLPDPRVSALLVMATAPVVALVALDFVSPDLVARYALICVPAAVTLIAVAAVRSSNRIGASLVIVVIVVAAITTGVQQTRSFKYENYRQAADVMGDLAVPGSTVMFLPISTRVGYEPYRDLEPDLSRVSDAAAAIRPLNGVARIGGIDQPPDVLAQRFDQSPLIFVLGDSVPQASRSLRDATDVAQLAVLTHYRTARLIRSGDLYLSVLQPENSTTPLLATGRT